MGSLPDFNLLLVKHLFLLNIDLLITLFCMTVALPSYAFQTI